MLSTPPATTRSSQPERTFCAARFTASRPEAQKRLSCTPAHVKSQPALSAATLGMHRALLAHGRDARPCTTSSTCAVSKSLRRCSSVSRPASRLTGLTSYRLPSFLPLPRGVRMASKTNASLMGWFPWGLGLWRAFAGEAGVGRRVQPCSIFISPSNRFVKMATNRRIVLEPACHHPTPLCPGQRAALAGLHGLPAVAQAATKPYLADMHSHYGMFLPRLFGLDLARHMAEPAPCCWPGRRPTTTAGSP